MDDKKKFLLKKIKSEKKKIKDLDKVKNLEIELVKTKCSNEPDKIRNALEELNEIHAGKKNIHEIKSEILLDYTGEFEMFGELSIADHIRQTHIRFGNINDYESYIDAIDQDYESEDALFNGYIHKIKTPQFNLFNRSQHGNGCGFKHEFLVYRGNKCFLY